MDDNLEYENWCFENHIFLYGLSKDCQEGFCRIVKWVRGQPHEGKKLFEIATLESTIAELYQRIYLINHNQ